MDITFILQGDQRIILEPVSSKNYKGIFLPGSTLYQCVHPDVSLSLQEMTAPGFTIRLLVLKFLQKIGLTITENKPGIRFQAAIKHDLQYVSGKSKVVVKQGRFIIEHNPDAPILLTARKDREHQYLFSSYSPEFIANLGLGMNELHKIEKPRSLTPDMSRILRDMLDAPYEEQMLRFFYENKARDILFLALVQKEFMVSGELSAEEIEAVLAADMILLNNLREQIPVEDLVKKVKLNAFKLKKGFRKMFGMGIFERALHYRMERAKQLLLETDWPEKEIRRHAGYDRLTSFVTAFRKHFGIPPGQFRKKYR